MREVGSGQGRDHLTPQPRAEAQHSRREVPAAKRDQPSKRKIQRLSMKVTRILAPTGGTANPRLSAKKVEVPGVRVPGPPSTSGPRTVSGEQAKNRCAEAG